MKSQDARAPPFRRRLAFDRRSRDHVPLTLTVLVGGSRAAFTILYERKNEPGIPDDKIQSVLRYADRVIERLRPRPLVRPQVTADCATDSHRLTQTDGRCVCVFA